MKAGKGIVTHTGLQACKEELEDYDEEEFKVKDSDSESESEKHVLI